MNLLIDFFNLILYQPLLNALILLYQYLPGHDFGIAVIILTILIRIILYPLMVQSIRSQKVLSELQLKIQEIKQKYKTDQERQVKEMIGLYQKEKINPFGGCLPFLIQLPILIALYRVFWKGLEPEAMTHLYSFVPHPDVIDPTFFGVINLAQPNLGISVLSGAIQFFQSKMFVPKAFKTKQKDEMAQFSEIFQKQMLYFFPIFTVLILLKLPAAIGLYWIVTASFSILQHHLIFKQPKGKEDKSL